MIKKSIIALIVILAIVGLAFAANNLNTKNSTTTTNSTSPQKQINVSNNNTNNNTTTQSNNTQTKISPTEAQKIAKTYINASGATAGTPKLVNQSGKLIYIVPVIDNGKNVGEIDIDAQNGQNLGGAGGAP